MWGAEGIRRETTSRISCTLQPVTLHFPIVCFLLLSATIIASIQHTSYSTIHNAITNRETFEIYCTQHTITLHTIIYAKERFLRHFLLLVLLYMKTIWKSTACNHMIRKKYISTGSTVYVLCVADMACTRYWYNCKSVKLRKGDVPLLRYLTLDWPLVSQWVLEVWSVMLSMLFHLLYHNYSNCSCSCCENYLFQIP